MKSLKTKPKKLTVPEQTYDTKETAQYLELFQIQPGSVMTKTALRTLPRLAKLKKFLVWRLFQKPNFTSLETHQAATRQ